MAEFINTKKEIFLGDMYFKEHVMPVDFEYKKFKKETNTFFSNYGFNVSKMYKAFYTMMNGIESDHYMSMDLYYFYVLPALNKYDFKDAWLDKNIYSLLFPDAKQPKSVVKNMNGLYFAEGQRITRNDAIKIVSSSEKEMIIKPTIRTCNGDGVKQITETHEDFINMLFDDYKRDFIIQEKVNQHKILEQLNPSSLNTIRLFTYRDLTGTISFVDNTFIRYGGKDAVIDNASAGGCFLAVSADGIIQDKTYRFKDMTIGSLAKEKGLVNLTIPAFEEAKKFVINLHERLPYFDFVGWDVYIDVDNNPSFIEYNLVPSCECPQIVGPLFKGYLDEVLKRSSIVDKTVVHYIQNSFDKGNSIFHINIQ